MCFDTPLLKFMNPLLLLCEATVSPLFLCSEGGTTVSGDVGRTWSLTTAETTAPCTNTSCLGTLLYTRYIQLSQMTNSLAFEENLLQLTKTGGFGKNIHKYIFFITHLWQVVSMQVMIMEINSLHCRTICFLLAITSVCRKICFCATLLKLAFYIFKLIAITTVHVGGYLL